MIFRRSTRSIVTRKRRKTPTEASDANDNPQPAESLEDDSGASEMAHKPQIDIGVIFMRKVNLPIWALSTCCFIMVVLLILIAVLLFPRSADTTDQPDDTVTVVLPEVDAEHSIVSVKADPALAALVSPGDAVQLYDSEGTVITALQYVQVYQGAEDGHLLLIVDDLQADAIVSQSISDRIILVAHDNASQADTLLDLQDRINDPQITLTLQAEVLAALGAKLPLEYQAGIQPAEAPLPEIQWQSENPDTAVVKDGTLYAMGVGTTTITAICGDVQASCCVTVEIPLQQIQLDKQSASIAVGETLQMTATPAPEDATHFSVTWSSDNTDVATVSEDGIVTGITPGTVTITARSGDVSVQCSITVGYHAEVVQLDREAIALAIGQTYKLTPTIYPGTDMIDALQFESSNPKVVTVTSDGTVTALAAGKAYVTFRCGNATAKCLVTVTATETQP